MEIQEPRRLYRSRTDRVIGGVCGGIARYFNIDPVIVRIAAVVLVFLAGLSALAYVAALVLVPTEPADGQAPPPKSRLSDAKPLTIVAIAIGLLVAAPLVIGGGLALAGIGIPLAFLALVGLATWWLVSGEGPGEGAGEVLKRAALGVAVLVGCFLIFVAGAWAAGIGGGTTAAVVVIVAGALLVVSAFAGGLRALILPTLALALGIGFVSAAGVDLHGGVGHREYRPAAASDIRDRYRLGVGHLVVDLRETELPPGDTPVKLKVGVGDALVLVRPDVCVASSADIGAGGIDVFDRNDGGLDFDWDDQPRAGAGGSRVVVDADVGIGAFEVQHERHDRGFGPRHRFHNGDGESNTGCTSAA